MTEPGITQLLQAVGDGDPAALNDLFDLLYPELHALAHHQLARNERQTLDTTAIVHEVYLRFVRHGAVSSTCRRHFFALCAKSMRQIIIDHARRYLAGKRGGGVTHTVLDEGTLSIEERADELVALDRELERLTAMDPRLARVVELRFYAGLNVDEAADALGVAASTVKRDWRKARAWLYSRLSSELAE
ncbi:MAG: ECF-type sigma factor [bacterium]